LNTLTWINTGSGAWTDGANWDLGTAPATGDTTYVGIGTPTITGDITDERIWLNFPAGNAQLDLAGGTLDASSFLAANAAVTTTLFFTLDSVNNGAMQFGDSAAGNVHIYVGNAASFTNHGAISIDGNAAIMGPGSFINAADGAITVLNYINSPVVENLGFSPHVTNNGAIIIDGSAASSAASTVVNFNTLAGTGTISLGSAQVNITGTTTAGSTFAFTDGNALLTLNAAQASFASTITGFRPGDTIDLGTNAVPNLAVTNMVYTAGTLGAPGSLTFAIDQNDIPYADVVLSIAGPYQPTDFTLTKTTPTGGADYVVTTSAAPCYAAGSRIATPGGEVAVEHLRPGDQVLSAFGGRVAIAWIGHRRVDCRRHPRPQDVHPVRIQAGAFADGLPVRDLYLSPDHAVFVDGVLIPVRYLINGATIAQIPVGQITYHHVELPAHDVLLAEGLPAESYLDTGNRAAFANAPGAVHLHADFVRTIWQSQACADLITAGPSLAATKRHLLRRAAALGHVATDDPGLVLLVDGMPRAPDISGNVWVLPLQPGDRALRLVSRTCVPAHLRPDSDDHRRLGVALAAIRLDARPLALDDPALASGSHDLESGPAGTLRWTDGDAALALHGAASVTLTLTLALTGRYWRAAPAERHNRTA